MKIEFTIPGEPKGKGRPRFTKSGHAYTPKSTAEYETAVKAAYYEAVGANCRFEAGIPLGMHITAYCGIPKSAGKKKHADMMSQLILPTKKPDADNIVKVIADALNRVAYYDDAQIVHLSYGKVYGETPHVNVVIENLMNQERKYVE